MGTYGTHETLFRPSIRLTEQPNLVAHPRKRRYKSWADLRVRGFARRGRPVFSPVPGPYVNTCAHAKFGDDLPTWAPSYQAETVDVPVSELGGGRRLQAAAA